MLADLIGNGIRHTPDAGTVHIVARAVDGGGVEIGVSDACGGILDDERDQVFDVAFRGTQARSPEAPDAVERAVPAPARNSPSSRGSSRRTPAP